VHAGDVVIETRVGGRWDERSEDGKTCDWGSAVAWEPPLRVVLSWEINTDDGDYRGCWLLYCHAMRPICTLAAS